MDIKTFENELDKLRAMLDEAGIPYESYQKEWPQEQIEMTPELFKGNARWIQNQIVYGREDAIAWKLDGICQYGSYGVAQGLIETYGKLGADAEGDPLVLTAAEAFEIIKEDWEKNR